MVMTAIIETRKASFSYGKLKVLDNIDLKVEEGDIFCLFGPNGCGKTTLIQCLLGILKPSGGTVLIQGRDIRGMKAVEIARKLAYIPQVHEKPFPYKVIDVVLMGRVSYTGLFHCQRKRTGELPRRPWTGWGCCPLKINPIRS